MAIWVIRVVDLISNAPHNDAWMVAVTAYHIGEITLMPLWEIFCVALMLWRIYIMTGRPLILRIFPLIECLIHH